jgi:hypothetical protein
MLGYSRFIGAKFGLGAIAVRVFFNPGKNVVSFIGEVSVFTLAHIRRFANQQYRRTYVEAKTAQHEQPLYKRSE